MENLADIPTKDDVPLSERESTLLNEYFGESNGNDRSNGAMSWSGALKTSGYGVLLFAVLSNPWINAIFYKIPYMANNPILVFCVKLFIFAFAMLLIVKMTA